MRAVFPHTALQLVVARVGLSSPIGNFTRQLNRLHRRTGGREELAATIIDPQNPLTARVFVNRIWQHHFGAGLVCTPSNFGTLGESPTHPELLDWLASEFVAQGWSLKSLHRQIMTSATYQLGSDYDEESFRADGDNRTTAKQHCASAVSVFLEQQFHGGACEVAGGQIARGEQFG